MSKYGKTQTVLHEEKYLVEVLKEMGCEVEASPEGARLQLLLLGPGEKGRWRVSQLERKIGQQVLEIDFLKGCFERIDEQRKLQALAGRPLSTSRSKSEEVRERL